jgi:hypothetical protein
LSRSDAFIATPVPVILPHGYRSLFVVAQASKSLLFTTWAEPESSVMMLPVCDVASLPRFKRKHSSLVG